MGSRRGYEPSVSSRIVKTSIVFFASISFLTGCSSWHYKTTLDHQWKIGRSGQRISIESQGLIAKLQVPRGWHIVACTDQPMDCLVAAGSNSKGVGFDLNEGAWDGKSLSVEEQYKNNLETIQHHSDPAVQMVSVPPFHLRDGRELPAYRYFSDYWGQRLAVFIPEGNETVCLEFSSHRSKASALKDLESSYGEIQKILDGYSCTRK